MLLKAAGGKCEKLSFRELSILIIFKFELKARLDESEEEEEEEEEAVDKEGGSDFTGATVEAWTGFNRLERLTTRKI